MNLLSVHACNNSLAPFNRPSAYPGARRVLAGHPIGVGLAALGAAHRGFGQAVPNPLRNAQARFLGSLFEGLMLRSRNGEGKVRLQRF
jgi:hypothetical protein